MPNHFELVPKSGVNSAGDNAAEFLNVVDEQMCAHFGFPVDKAKWFANWYNTVGFSLAIGMTFDQQRDRAIERALEEEENVDYQHGEEQLQIIDWLDANYTPRVWCSR